MNVEFYPRVDKSIIFRGGYIAEKSRHRRGITIDLTPVELPVYTRPAIRAQQGLNQLYRNGIGEIVRKINRV
ncbi:hypothetical protein ABFA25_08025 [Mycobacterium lepromatosis]|nr:hypothetical protein [Mycobacterium lepromatosis]